MNLQEITKLLQKELPLNSEQREFALAEALELIDALYQERDTKSLGRLQAAIGKVKPRSSDTQTVLEACSKARKNKL